MQRPRLPGPLFLNAHIQFFFVSSVYCAIIEFICDNVKENWELGNEATNTLVLKVIPYSNKTSWH